MKSFLSTLPLLLLGCTEPETRTSLIVQVEADDPQVLLQLAKKLKNGTSAAEADTAKLDSAYDTLAILMKLCGTVLRPAVRESNVHLLYALVHEEEKLASVFADSDALASLQASATEANEPGTVLYPAEVVELTHSYLSIHLTSTLLKWNWRAARHHRPSALRR